MTSLAVNPLPEHSFVDLGQRLRVLHLGAGNMYGGIERVLAVIAESRDLAPGMRPLFGLCFQGRLQDELLATGVPVFDFGPVRLSRPWTVSKARRVLRRTVSDHDVDVVVTHGFWSHALFGPSLRGTEAALVHWAHGPFDSRRWLDRVGTWTRPELVLANSRFTAESFKSAFPSVRCDIVGLPARLSTPTDAPRTRGEVRRSLGTPEDAVVITMVSRIEPLKGHAVLLDALRILDASKTPRSAAEQGRAGGAPAKKRSPWECWIIGGAQRSEEKRLLASLTRQGTTKGLGERVRFLGVCNNVSELLAASDVYCQPNTRPEAFGLSFIEALNAKLPVVTSRLGGPPEYLDKSCSILTPPGDASAVAAALRRLIDDAELRRELGRNGPAKARATCDPVERLAALERALDSVRKVVQWA